MLIAALAACHGGEVWTPAKERDTKDDPRQVRPGYGNAEAHVWWPLTEPELAALKGVEPAKQGDMHALLALAIVASGDHRDAASHAEYEQRIDRFVAELKPTIDAADEWHRGYELNRAMHRVFSGAESSELGSYSLDQAHVTGIFTTGKYNCLSSALLYAVLARGFAIPVRGVLVPTHAFVELGAVGGKVLEVETTSNTGFDWVHDERFYKEGAAKWSSSRGLRPVTLADYQHREILEPYRFVARAMLDGRAGETDEDRARLAELAALVAPEDADVQKAAIATYITEANDLFDRKAWRTMAQLFDTVGPTIASLGAKMTDPDVVQHLSWTHWYHAHALVIAGRPDEAIAIMDQNLGHLDPKWPDYDKLRKNYLAVLMDHLLGLMHDKNYASAIKLITPRFEVCKSDAECADNLGIIYRNQAIEHENGGHYKAARAALKECVALLPNVKACADALEDLESRRSF